MQISNETAAIVTGGGSGLGRGTARALAKKGARVTVLDINEAGGRAVADEIGGDFQRCDVADADSVRAAVAAAAEAFGVPRVLVNCAGIVAGAKTVSRGEAHDPALFRKVIGINLFGSFNLASQVATLMSEAQPVNSDGERGVIVSTASVAAFDGQIGQIAYAASKAAIAGMTLPMARDLARLGIRVMTIAPGIFETPMLTGMPQEVQDSLAASIPFPSRLGTAEEYAALVRPYRRKCNAERRNHPSRRRDPDAAEIGKADCGANEQAPERRFGACSSG